MTKITELNEWHALQAHQKTIATEHMRTWFAEDSQRFQRFSLQLGPILFDFSKNRITDETLRLLLQLAYATQLPQKIKDLFSGKPLNSSEQRPALHTALRSNSVGTITVAGKNIVPEIQDVLKQIQLFVEKVRNQQWLGTTGKPIRDIVNIGIGGSHLGPLMATYALQDFASAKLRCHFISNIDSVHIHEVLNQIDPETTLFIISSKSFTTLETLTNANTIRQWMQQKLQGKSLTPHFVAVTAATDKACKFGIPNEQIFPIWRWVGGRYSVWSAIGLPLAIMIGMDHFFEFLSGGAAADQHFLETEFSKNIPVIMALLGIWYINFFDAQNHAIVPYSQRLNYLRAHLQQLDMESNGKQITKDGSAIDYATGPIIFGEHGCNGQHAFHQLFHQGQYLIPLDFILVGNHDPNWQAHHDVLIASGLSQAQALMQGKSLQQALTEAGEDSSVLAMQKSIPGNRPSNTFFLENLTPYSLGMLLALYEHKVFVQGAIWNINSFDQWGVELGKQLLPSILADLQKSDVGSQHDSSTLGLIKHYKNLRKNRV